MPQHLDDFFERAINTARDLGKARKKTRQKQQDFENVATNKSFALEERRVATGEAGQESRANLGQQEIDLGRASLKVRKQLGQGALAVQGRGVGVQEGQLGLNQARFKRSSDVFNRLFPQGNTDQNAGIAGGFRQKSDQGVLDTASALATRDKNRPKGARASVLNNPKVQEVIRKARERGGLKSTLEQDLLSLR